MQAIILCGGKGERLGSLTNNCPKGMILIEGKPILEYQIEWLKKHGIKKVIFACGYAYEKIQKYFENGTKFDIEIDYSIEEEQLGRGGALKNAWVKLDKCQNVVITNGDIYTELDLTKVISVHNEKIKQKGIKITISLFPYVSSYGIVLIDSENLINNFQEKPILPYWINGGVYIFEYEVGEYLPEKGDHETSTFLQFTREKLIYGFRSGDYWKSIETVKDINEFLNYINNERQKWKKFHL